MTDKCQNVSNIQLEESSLALFTSSVLILCFSLLTLVLGSYWFFLNRKKFVLLRKRNLTLIFALTLGNLIVTVTGMLRAILGADLFPCRLLFVCYIQGFLCIGLATLARLCSLYWRVKFNEKLIDHTYTAVIGGDINAKSFKSFSALGDIDNYDRATYYTPLFEKNNKQSNNEQQRCLQIQQVTVSFVLKLLCWDSPDDMPRTLRFAHLLASKYFAVVFWLILVVPQFIWQVYLVLDEVPSSECRGCLYQDILRTSFPVILLTALAGFPFFYVLYQLRNSPDSLGIKTELIVSGSIFVSVLFGVIYPLAFESATIAKAEVQGTFHLTILDALLLWVLYIYIIPYQVWKVKRRSKGEYIEGNLGMLLSSVEGRKAFSLYLVTNLSYETLAFYETIEEWRVSFERLSNEVRKQRAEFIYKTFIDEDAFLLINICHKTRNAIKESLGNDVDINIFDKASKFVFSQMSNDLFPRFIKSSFYKAYTNEIQTSI